MPLGFLADTPGGPVPFTGPSGAASRSARHRYGLLAWAGDVTAVRGSVAGRDWSGRAEPRSEEDAVSELDRLEAAMSECREMIREAHAATKDLRLILRRREIEAQTSTSDLRHVASPSG